MTERKRGPREGSIFQRASDGRWVAAVHLGYDPSTGKRVRKVVYGATYDDVLQKRTELMERQRVGEPLAFPRRSVGAFFDEWLAAKEGSLKPATISCYRYLAQSHILPALGTRQLAELDQSDVLAFVRGVRRYTRNGKPLAPSTVRKIFDTLNRAMKDAQRWGMAPRNVVALIDRPRAERHEMSYLEKEQVDALLAAARGTRDEALFTLAIMLGLRRGELLALRWKEDIDLDKGVLRVNRTLGRVRGRLILGTPKSAKSRRVIRLPSRCIAALKDHKRLQLEERLAAPHWQDQGLVFPSVSGTPFDPTNMGRHLDKLLRQASLPHIRVHDLRHTAASLMIAQRLDPLTVSATLGHASVSITYNLYGHLMDSQRQGFADAMDALFGDA